MTNIALKILLLLLTYFWHAMQSFYNLKTLFNLINHSSEFVYCFAHGRSMAMVNYGAK